MRTLKYIAATLFASVITTGLVYADPFDPKRVPAEAKWVVHADLDAARDTKSFQAICDKVLSNADAQAKINQIEQISGMRIPEDLNDLTIYGKGPGEESGVILVHGHIDRERTVTALHMADQFASNPFGSYDVLTWLDKEKNQTMFGAFHDASNLIIGRSEKNIKTALDAMDGKAESLKADSPLAAGAKPQLLMYVAATDMMNLHGPDAKPNPIAASIQSAWISMSEKQDTVTLRAELKGTNADSASDLKDTLDGLKGMLRMAARGESPDPVAKAVVAASKTFATSLKESTVVVDWPMPEDEVEMILSAIVQKHSHHE